MRWASSRSAILATLIRCRPCLAACLFLAAASVAAAEQNPPAAAGTPAITHGPILGRPGSDRMGVWARTARPGKFRVRYGVDPQRLDKLSEPVVTRLENDNTGWIALKGLKADTKYHFQVVPAEAGENGAASASRDRAGPAGSFRTLPDGEEYRNAKHNPRGLFNFRFEAGSCANQGEHSLGPALPAYKTMLGHLGDKIHFAIMNGDWLYEDHREYGVDAWRKQVGLGPQNELPRNVRLAPPLVGMWENYKSYLTNGKNLAAWHRHVPSYFTFDDHEILNDVVAAGSAGKRDRRTVFRDIALEAWYDYLAWSNPVEFKQGIWLGRARLAAGSDVLTDTDADFTQLDLKQAANLHVHWGTPDAGVNDPELDRQGGDPNAGVYDLVEVLDKNRLRIRPAAKADGQAGYSIGRRSYYKSRVGNCEFFYLDTRTHRQQHDIRQPAKPGVSMLGQRQKEWLIEGMSASDADFFFVVSSVPFTIPHVDAGGMAFAAADKDDAWTAFVDEREQLIRHWEGLGRPVFVLTGDLHNSFAIKISNRVWEFCCGPHNSMNHPASAEGHRPINGTFDSRGRQCEIRWSTYFLDEVPRPLRFHPVYCLVQVNNVFNNPPTANQPYWVAYPRPQVVFQYFDGLSGEMLYAESVLGESRQAAAGR